MQSTGRVTNLNRIDNSENGNPNYTFKVNETTIQTEVDSMENYRLPNYENKEVTVSYYNILDLHKHTHVYKLKSIKLIK